MRDVFVPDLDEADTGIQGRISNLVSLLALHDPEVSAHLDDCGIDASFYAIRWLTTLLSREFLLPDTIRLWDSMFASTHKDNFLRYVCVTMVMIVRKDLLKGDFSTCLRLLQSYPPTNVDDLLESSRALWIYESQVTLACHKGGISLQKALNNIAPPPAILMYVFLKKKLWMICLLLLLMQCSYTPALFRLLACAGLMVCLVVSRLNIPNGHKHREKAILCRRQKIQKKEWVRL